MDVRLRSFNQGSFGDNKGLYLMKNNIVILSESTARASIILASLIRAGIDGSRVNIINTPNHLFEVADKLYLDLIIVDLTRSDNFNLCQTLKADFRTQATPLIAIGSNGRMQTFREALHAGADYYVPDGSTAPKSLIRLVEEILDEKLDEPTLPPNLSMPISA
jgi:CheY-like chemotaxis protein